MIFRAPTLDKGHPDGAHLGQLVDCLEAMVDRLREKSGKLLVVEDLETAAGGDLADSGRVEPEWEKSQKLIFCRNLPVVIVAVP